MNTPTPKIELRDPCSGGWRAHPLRARMPKRVTDSDQFSALVEDIRAHGVNQPIDITADGQIIDGLDRWQAAKDLQLASVPVIVREADDAARLIVTGLVARKQMTRGAAVYAVMPLLADFFANAERRRLDNLVKGKNTGEQIPKSLQKPQCFSKSADRTSGDLSDGDRDVVCGRLGVKKTVFHQARTAYLLLNDPTAAPLQAEYAKQGRNLTPAEAVAEQTRLREELEPRLLEGEISVGHVLAGIGGKAATVDKPRVDSISGTAAAFRRVVMKTHLNSLPKLVEYLDQDSSEEELEQIHATSSELARLTGELLTAKGHPVADV